MTLIYCKKMSIAVGIKNNLPVPWKDYLIKLLIRLYRFVGKYIQNFGDDLLVCSAFLADFFDNYAIYSDICPENQIGRANTQSIADGEERQKTRSGFSVLNV